MAAQWTISDLFPDFLSDSAYLGVLAFDHGLEPDVGTENICGDQELCRSFCRQQSKSGFTAISCQLWCCALQAG